MRKNRSYKLLSQVFSSADVSIYALLFPDEMVAQATNFQVSSRNKGYLLRGGGGCGSGAEVLMVGRSAAAALPMVLIAQAPGVKNTMRRKFQKSGLVRKT